MSKESILKKLSVVSERDSNTIEKKTKRHKVPASATDGLDKVKKLLDIIKESGADSSMYTSDKKAISFIFSNLPEPYSFSSILVKLTIIDSLYSTQMGRRYYGLDELASVLSEIHNGRSLNELFRDLASAEVSSADVRFCAKGTNLFTEKYGIGKDGNDKGTAVSLISKYAYFETTGHFPIYDSIAKEMYPKVWLYCGFPKSGLISKSEMSSNIDSYILAINRLKESLNDSALTYDHIDRLLWTTGKILRGNMSLILSMDEYLFLKSRNMLDGGRFDIEKVDIDKLTFLKSNIFLLECFKLAKNLKNYEC